MEYKFCIAGKNLIAINAINILLRLEIKRENIFACFNRNDTGINTWQPSFKDYCRRQRIKSVILDELYLIENLYFFSLEFDQLIDINKFKTRKLYNIHFSLLPRYKGMYTSIWPVLNSEKQTGVTLHEIDNGIDTGDIIDQIKFNIGKSNSIDIYKKYIEKGTTIFDNNIVKLLNGNFLKLKQGHENSTYYSKTSIDFTKTQIPLKTTAFEIKRWVQSISFRPFQMATHKSIPISHVQNEIHKSINKPGQELEDNDLFIKISTVDYDVRLYKDKIVEILDAARNNGENYILKILKHGYNINDWGENGWTPLMVASYYGCYETVELLIENGADLKCC
jgi:methionyl-tRNA formyltransferase